MTLLGSGGEGAPAVSAPNFSPQVEEVSLLFGVRLAKEGDLHLVKELFGNNRFVIALVEFPVSFHQSEIKRVEQKLVNFALVHLASRAGTETAFIENSGNIFDAVPARRIEIERFADIRRAFFIDENRFVYFVVQVSQGGSTRPNTFFDFGFQASFHIDAQIIGILFAHTKINREHKLINRVVDDHFVNRANFFDIPVLQKFDNPRPIENISSQSVNLPCQNDTILVLGEICQHIIENRPTDFLGGHAFLIDFLDLNTELVRHARHFSLLRLDRHSLAFFLFTGFSGVEDVFHMVPT